MRALSCTFNKLLLFPVAFFDSSDSVEGICGIDALSYFLMELIYSNNTFDAMLYDVSVTPDSLMMSL